MAAMRRRRRRWQQQRRRLNFALARQPFVARFYNARDAVRDERLMVEIAAFTFSKQVYKWREEKIVRLVFMTTTRSHTHTMQTGCFYLYKYLISKRHCAFKQTIFCVRFLVIRFLHAKEDLFSMR